MPRITKAVIYRKGLCRVIDERRSTVLSEVVCDQMNVSYSLGWRMMGHVCIKRSRDIIQNEYSFNGSRFERNGVICVNGPTYLHFLFTCPTDILPV